MQTLKSSAEIKEYFVDNIIANLPRVDVNTVSLLIDNTDLDVTAKSDNVNLNDNFNSFIKTMSNVNEINVSYLTEFFFYYQILLQNFKIPFPIISSK